MNHYPHPIIAREGWAFVALALAVALVLSFTSLWILAVLAWLVLAFIVQFFRDPPRKVPHDPNAVLSPADGKVVRVERARDPYLDRDALKISVFMNVFNVHSNRSPVDGTVVAAWYHAGSFVNAASGASEGPAFAFASFGAGGRSWAVSMPLTPGMASAARASMFRTRQCGIGLSSSLQNSMPSAR